MQKGQISTTAQTVAYCRALGNLAPQVPGFSDPVAGRLLPEAWAEKLAQGQERLRRKPAASPFPFWMRGLALCCQFRTVMLDRAILEALPVDQLMILGAGLDSRAWRLPMLDGTRVYELDHPDTQAWKRKRVAALPLLARSAQLLPVDLADPGDLPARLEAAGYRREASSFWLCEGLAMYLSMKETIALLAMVAELAAPGSRIALTYMGRKNGQPPGGFFPSLLMMLGEPLRSSHDPGTLGLAAGATGWHTLSDTGIQDWQPMVAPGTPVSERTLGFQGNERIWLGERA